MSMSSHIPTRAGDPLGAMLELALMLVLGLAWKLVGGAVMRGGR